MSAYRCLILITSLLLLSGCDAFKDSDQLRTELKTSQDSITKLTSDNKGLESENSYLKLKADTLSSRINSDYVTKAVELEKQESDAAITQACTQPFNINFCPKSMIKPGEDAIKNGVSGGSNPKFWTVYIFKWSLLVFTFFMLPFTLGRILVYLFKSNLVQIANSKYILIDQDAKFQEALKNEQIAIKNTKLITSQCDEKCAEREKACDSYLSQRQDKIDNLDKEFELKTNELAAIEDKAISRDTAIGALRAFDL